MKWTILDVARLFHVTPQQVNQWIERDGLPAVRLKERTHLNRLDVLEWAVARGRMVPPEAAPTAVDGSGILSLAAALEAGGIYYKVPNHDRAAALRAVVQRLPLPPGADRELALEVLLARERLGSTGVGDGIAIPHIRGPLVFPVEKPFVTLCFLDGMVDFGAIDGRPVDTLFALIAPTIRGHLALLSHLSYAVHDPNFRDALKKKLPEAEIFSCLKTLESSLPPEMKT